MASAAPSSGSPSAPPLTATEIPSQIDLLISLHLHLWQALSITIQNGWGTSNPQIGSDKRDWLAGAISDLFAQNQLRDVEDLEEVLENVMNDEFEVDVDDGSLEEVSRKIWKGVERVKKGDDTEVKELMATWEEKKRKGNHTINVVKGKNNEEDDSSDDDDDEADEEWNGFQDSPARGNSSMDIDMDEAPALVHAAPRQNAPEIDEDGFTKVVGKKKR